MLNIKTVADTYNVNYVAISNTILRACDESCKCQLKYNSKNELLLPYLVLAHVSKDLAGFLGEDVVSKLMDDYSTEELEADLNDSHAEILRQSKIIRTLERKTLKSEKKLEKDLIKLSTPELEKFIQENTPYVLEIQRELDKKILQSKLVAVNKELIRRRKKTLNPFLSKQKL